MVTWMKTGFNSINSEEYNKRDYTYIASPAKSYDRLNDMISGDYDYTGGYYYRDKAPLAYDAMVVSPPPPPPVAGQKEAKTEAANSRHMKIPKSAAKDRD